MCVRSLKTQQAVLLQLYVTDFEAPPVLMLTNELMDVNEIDATTHR